MNRTFAKYIHGFSVLVLLIGVAALYQDARGEGVAQVLTEKSLPAATVDVIDPESGSSSGGSNSDVNIGVGDIISFTFSFTPVPDKVNRGLQGYLTEYIPPNTEVVGVRLIDKNGFTVLPRRAGLTVDGCAGGSTCNSFNGLPGTVGNHQTGSIAQLHADTGVFFSTDGRTRKLTADAPPATEFISTINGIVMDPEPRTISPGIVALLSASGQANYFAHNDWDWDQVQAYGFGGDAANVDGVGNTPHFYGSPIAGPFVHYSKEATDVGDTCHGGGSDGNPCVDDGDCAGNGECRDTIEFDDVDGPWQRMVYPGSEVGDPAGQGDLGATGNITRVGIPARNLAFVDPELDPRFIEFDPNATPAPLADGFDITPARPANRCDDGSGALCTGVGTACGAGGTCQKANAVRYAMGETRTGNVAGAEISLRVINPTGANPFFLDDEFAGTGGNVNCAEVIGSDVAARGSNSGGKDNPWPTYIGSPQCAFLRLLFDLTVDQDLATSGAPQETYTLTGKNLSVAPETNVLIRLKFDSSRQAFVSARLLVNGTEVSAAPDRIQTCTDDSTKQCAEFDVAVLQPSDDFVVEAEFDAGGFGQTTNILVAAYESTELPAPGYETQAITIVEGIAVLGGSVGVIEEQTAGNGIIESGEVAHITANITNSGTEDFTGDFLCFILPPGWNLQGTPTFDNVAMTPSGSCQGGHPRFGLDGSVDDIDANAPARVVDFNVTTANGPGLFPIDLSIEGSQPAFGGNFETLFNDIIIVPVDKVRSDPPVLDCEQLGFLASSTGSVTGTTTEADGTIIRLYFNLVERAEATASGGAFTIPSSAWASFGELYGGIEVRASAQSTNPAELESQLSQHCFVRLQRECSDGVDNADPEDNLADFPADPGCDSPFDNDETDPPAAECSNNGAFGVANPDDDNDGDIDWPQDAQCFAKEDPFEGGLCVKGSDNEGAFCQVDGDCVNGTCEGACSDGFDNDGDGFIDTNLIDGDPDCLGNPGNQTEHTFMACQNGIDDDGDCPPGNDANGDGITCGPGDVGVDFDPNPALGDSGCHSAFDDDESDESAADVRPRVLVILDSSGSMNANTCNRTFTGGDGSFECGGNDVPCSECDDSQFSTNPTCGDGVENDSRLFKVKTGIRNVVAGFGDVEYGLMRFKQRAEPFECPTPSAGLQSGGWQGGGGNNCPQFDEGELVVGFSDENQQTMIQWLDGTSNYPTSNPLEVPPDLDWEIRGSGTTPLAGSLATARQLISDQRAQDDAAGIRAGCRPYLVILVTDGLDTCAPNPSDPRTEAENLFGAGVPVKVIGFATTAQEIIDGLNDIARGGSNGNEDAIFAEDDAALSDAMATIISQTILVELCNNIDDDCDCREEGIPFGFGDTNGDGIECGDGDAKVDEDFIDKGADCSAGTGVCLTGGNRVCTPGFCSDNNSQPCLLDSECGGVCLDSGSGGPPGGLTSTQCDAVPPTAGTELCPLNGLDDDCDGNIDEGLVNCNCIPLGGIGSNLELCNGVDDDCDCVEQNPNDDGGDGIVCNDGDSFVDESVGLIGVGDVCNGGLLGTCSPGTTACVAGQIACQGGQGPINEICGDGLDNDCDCTGDTNGDGVICEDGPGGLDVNVDEGFVECYDPPSPLPANTGCFGTPFSCLGVCKTGKELCANPGVCPQSPAPPAVPDPNGAIYPTQDVCDGLDNDCDGSIDEDFPNLGSTCDNGLFSECFQQGIVVCSADKLSEVCTAQPVNGLPEICDGIDNDCDCPDVDSNADGVVCGCTAAGCDTNVDEVSDLGPPIGEVCGGSTVCGQGTFECVNGSIECTGGAGASDESCNAIDDDCDGSIDEETLFDSNGVPLTGQDCTAPGFECGFCTGGANDSQACTSDAQCFAACAGGAEPANTPCSNNADCTQGGTCTNTATCTLTGMPGCDIGECEFGGKVCLAGGVFCDNYQGPTAEICDGLDNDCDGQVDDLADCPIATDACFEGSCVSPCDQGEFPCPFGFFCQTIPEGDFCVLDPCLNVNCPPGQFCDSDQGGVCVDPCVGVNCQPGEVCNFGSCEDCLDFGCPTGQNCVIDQNGVGVCQADPCADVECDAGEFCRDGDCVPLECDPECRSNELCIDGECVADLCADVTCPAGEVCDRDTGECVDDLCQGQFCSTGQICDPQTGDCVNDPCNEINCPSGSECVAIDADNGTCIRPEEPKGDRITTGGSGCNSSGGSGSPLTLLLLLLVAGVVRRVGLAE